MSFEERHSVVEADPLVELKRRCRLWASCPGADGAPLSPTSQIVPLETIWAAIAELEIWRASARIIPRGNG